MSPLQLWKKRASATISFHARAIGVATVCEGPVVVGLATCRSHVEATNKFGVPAYRASARALPTLRAHRDVVCACRWHFRCAMYRAAIVGGRLLRSHHSRASAISA